MRTLTSIGLLSALLLASPWPALAKRPQVTGDCPPEIAAEIEKAVARECPCDADGQGAAWKNHGKYVSCVVRYRNSLRRQGCLLDRTANRTIAKCAARSTCGKEGAVLCCVYDTSGTCEGDPVPEDGTKEGQCNNDETVACDTDTDCITATGPRLSRHAERCTDRGGTVVGGGSVCSVCPIPPPAPPAP